MGRYGVTELSQVELALWLLWQAVYPLPNKTDHQFDIQEKVAPEVAKIKRKIEDDKKHI